ncbi:MotA/TolQ/ExbB proton channel family protein [Limibacter armeniacum]|uniref:MotA/TolQ/ExbB proton channel family protein n=1 Tax=Limibacter armeniacum TaxID=466084 RepID=UPI002FE6B375
MTLLAALQEEALDAISIVDLVQKGGWTMAVLGVMSIITVYIFVTRMVVISKAKKEPRQLLDNVNSSVLKGDIEAAKAYCRKESTPMAKMLKAGLDHITSPLKNIEVSIENVGKIELYHLEKNVSLLGMISGAAPMIGFFGTVIGMITAFIAISQEEGSVSPKLLSEGIYGAMVTTAGGLLVGIAAYISYNFLVRQIEEVVHNMEVTTIEFIDLLQKPN